MILYEIKNSVNWCCRGGSTDKAVIVLNLFKQENRKYT